MKQIITTIIAVIFILPLVSFTEANIFRKDNLSLIEQEQYLQKQEDVYKNFNTCCLKLDVSIYTSTDIIQKGDSLVLSANVEGPAYTYGYKWESDDKDDPQFQDKIVINPEESKMYYVNVVDQCSRLTARDSIYIEVVSVN